MPDLRLLQGTGGGRSSAFGAIPDAGPILGRPLPSIPMDVPVEAVVPDPLVQAMREAEFSFAAPLEAAERQVEAVRSAGAVDALDSIEAEIPGPAGDIGEETLQEVQEQIAGQRKALEEAFQPRTRQLEIARVTDEVLPALMNRVRAMSGDDPRRAGDVFAKCEEIVDRFAPLIGAETAKAIGANAEREGARSIAESALAKGDFDGLAGFLEQEGHRLGEAARADVARRLDLHRESEAAATLESARRLVGDLVNGGLDPTGEVERLREVVDRKDDPSLRRELEAAEDILRFRKLTPGEKGAEVQNLLEKSADDPRAARLEAALNAERALIGRDPVEAARRAGVLTPPPFTLADEKAVDMGPALRRQAFTAQRWTGGRLRFTTNRQRDELADGFETATPSEQVRQLETLARMFGSFAGEVRQELMPVAPVMAAAGGLLDAGETRAARRILEGAEWLRSDPSALKGLRTQIKDGARKVLRERGTEEPVLVDAVLAAYAGEVMREGNRLEVGINWRRLESLVQKIGFDDLGRSLQNQENLDLSDSELNVGDWPNFVFDPKTIAEFKDPNVEKRIKVIARKLTHLDPGRIRLLQLLEFEPVEAAIRKVQKSLDISATGKLSETDPIARMITSATDRLLISADARNLSEGFKSAFRQVVQLQSHDDTRQEVSEAKQQALLPPVVSDPKGFVQGIIDLLNALFLAISGAIGEIKGPPMPRDNDGGIRG